MARNGEIVQRVGPEAAGRRARRSATLALAELSNIMALDSRFVCRSDSQQPLELAVASK